MCQQLAASTTSPSRPRPGSTSSSATGMPKRARPTSSVSTGRRPIRRCGNRARRAHVGEKSTMPGRISRRAAGRLMLLTASVAAAGLAVSAARGDVFLYEPFNYDPATVTQIKGQSPDGIRTWQVAGAGSGDLTGGLPHPVGGNLALPANMPASTGNECAYGGVGEGA